MSFDHQPVLKGKLVTLRPLRSEDYDDLYAVAADPQIWEQHPAKNRHEEAVFGEFFRESLASGGALLAIDAEAQRVIGSSRFHGYSEERSEVEIGWTFLARSHWGGAYNGELKQLMLRHAFRFVDSVVFFVSPENIRSQRAVEKVGGILEARADAAGRLVYRIHTSTMGVFDLTRAKLERWIADPDPEATLFGIQQDEDFILGTPENVPLLCEYLDRRNIPMARRTLIVLAMAEMLMLERSNDFVTEDLAETLGAALCRNPDAVVASFNGVVGLPAQLLLRRLLGQPTLSYERGGDSTLLVASPAPGGDEWASYVEDAFSHLASSLGVVFSRGDTHSRGLFAHGIRARYRDREFSLWCDTPGRLTLAHENLRPSHVPALLSALEVVYALGRGRFRQAE